MLYMVPAIDNVDGLSKKSCRELLLKKTKHNDAVLGIHFHSKSCFISYTLLKKNFCYKSGCVMWKNMYTNIHTHIVSLPPTSRPILLHLLEEKKIGDEVQASYVSLLNL